MDDDWWMNAPPEYYDAADAAVKTVSELRVVVGSRAELVEVYQRYPMQHGPYDLLYKRTDQPSVPEVCRDGLRPVLTLWFDRQAYRQSGLKLANPEHAPAAAEFYHNVYTLHSGCERLKYLTQDERDSREPGVQKPSLDKPCSQCPRLPRTYQQARDQDMALEDLL